MTWKKRRWMNWIKMIIHPHLNIHIHICVGDITPIAHDILSDCKHWVTMEELPPLTHNVQAASIHLCCTCVFSYL